MSRKSMIYKSISSATILGVVILMAFGLYQAIINTSPSCTSLAISSNDSILFGNNEDVSMPDSVVGFFPATNHRYGMVKVGYKRTNSERSWESFQGGMNEKGLAWDALGIPTTPLKPHYEREMAFWEDEFLGRILSYHSSVADVLEQVEKYDFGESMSMLVYVADAGGNAAIIGPGSDGEVGFIRKDTNEGYLLAVNQNPLIPEDKLGMWDNSTDRYDEASILLTQALGNKSITYQDVAEVLDAVHLSGPIHGFWRRLTAYSNVFDLKERKIYLYYQGQYNEVVELDLEDELAKGEHVIPLSDLFSTETLQEAEANFLKDITIGRLLNGMLVAVPVGILGLFIFWVYRKLRSR